jgi:predicted ATPase/signal transduction histidine kinase
MKPVVVLPETIAGCHPIEELYRGCKTAVYRAVREVDQQPVVIKLLTREHPTFGELLQFRNQYTIAKQLNNSGIIRLYSLDLWQHGYALVMEDFGGLSLRHYAQAQPLPVSEVLAIALQLTDILYELYCNQIVHKDLKPANILIHPETKQVKLIDFSIASLLPRETQEIRSPNVLEGTLAYLSPEQTGRMNRSIDYRCDFYSLGVTLFELLTGQLPFQSADPMELVHCHIAVQPPLAHTLNLNLPPIASEIVAKLLAKNPEDRYQSALGLKHDLELGLLQWQERGNLAWFTLGQRDLCDRFLIPDQLYGRDPEVMELLCAFNRVSAGRNELLLVAGFSGVGKTAVVNEVHKPIARQRGYFIKGKFDQFQRNIPFSALVQAFRDLMGQLLSETEAELEQWRAKILSALGDNAQVILEVIPELSYILKQQASAAQASVLQTGASEFSGSAAQNRFNLLFQKFIQVFTTPAHPLVMFIDDLQWADSASLKLIQLMLSDRAIGHLLVLGAYRDNEVLPVHPLMVMLKELQEAQTTVTTLTLLPLDQPSVNQLIADTLSCSSAVALPLTDLVITKTQGNPFFTTQFLKALHADGLITFNPEEHYWECDIAQVCRLSLTDDVIEFMALQLQKLSPATQAVLQLAACVGAQFDLATLAIMFQRSETETAVHLWSALKEGLVLPKSEVYKFFQNAGQDMLSTLDHSSWVNVQAQRSVDYRFLHDRVQQAAYSLIPDDQKHSTHLKIGQLLLQDATIAQQEEKVFAIVNQLNIGRSLITQPAAREQLVRLNLTAAQKAKASTAYSAALRYLEISIEYLPNESWQLQPEFTRSLYEEAAEVAYLNANFAQMEQFIAIVLAHTESLIDKIRVYEIKLMGAKAQGQLLEAIRVGLQVLQLLGIEFPAQPTPADIGQASEQTRLLWRDRPIASLLDAPAMTDPIQLAAMTILTALISPAYEAIPLLLPLLIFKQINLCIAAGNCAVSAYSYVDYGLILCDVAGDLEAGYQFGQLALAIVERFQAQSSRCRTAFVVNTFISHWRESLSSSLPRLQETHQVGLEIGDLEHSILSTQIYCAYAYFAGKELSTLASEMTTYRQVFSQLNHEASLDFLGIFHQTVLNLLGQSDDPCQLVGELYDEIQAMPTLHQLKRRSSLYYLHFNKSILHYLFSQPQKAAENVALTESYSDSLVGMFAVTLFCFYSALIDLALYPLMPDAEQNQLLEKVAVNQAKLKHWADHAPMNHLHKVYLVEAERQRVLGNKAEAIAHYDLAIQLAQENGYIQETALANELAAKFYLAWGKEKIAQFYLTEAYYAYSHWGAKAKVDDLEQRYPHLLEPILQKPDLPIPVSDAIVSLSNQTIQSFTSSTHISDSLDLAVLLKASQTLSSEIELEKLLSTLIQVVIEAAGAEKCALLMPRNNQWSIEAVSKLGQPAIVLQSISFEDHQTVPVSLINSVRNTLTPIAIENAAVDSTLIADPYILRQSPKSILCSPVLNQGKLVAIVYLENHLTAGAFTRDRVQLLNLICAQAAISLENASLYQDLQEQLRRIEFRAEVDISLTRSGSLHTILSPCTDALVKYLGAAFARIWTLNSQTNVLELQTSSGIYTHIDGAHARVPVGQFKIGLIAQEREPHLTNSVQTDPRVGDQEWARREGMVAFAGYPLLVENELVGVLALFARHPLSNSTLQILEIASHEIALGIKRQQSEAALRNSEARLRQQTGELEQAIRELQQAQTRIVQSEKMSALGNLVTGVAHEINNPIGFLSGNIQPALSYINDLFGLIDLYQQKYPAPDTEIQDEIETIDLDYIRQDLPKLVGSMREGVKRIKEISASLRTFSRADTDYPVACNIHDGIDSTLLILKHRLKANESRPEIRVITSYGNLPQVECYAGQLNQVFMNTLANAIDALEDSNQGRSFAEIQANPNQITVTTELSSDRTQAIIRIQDNGVGMTDTVKQKLFDHLFTTKQVGKGTGLGLAIAKQIIVEKHGGEIQVNSELGQGAEFRITLPLTANLQEDSTMKRPETATITAVYSF